MPSLKLTIAASVYAKPYKKIGRTITTVNSNTTNPAPTTASFLTSQTSSLPPSLSLNSNNSWRTLIPCACLPSNNKKNSENSTSCYFYHYTTTNNKSTPNENLLGFTFRGSVLFISRKSSSSTTRSSRSGSLSSSSTTSGSGNDMGPEDKIDDANWYNNDRLNSRQNTTKTPSPLPSMLNHNHQQQQAYSTILTLPTVLTIARVVAVPLLIATFYVDGWWGRTATTSIFIAAAVTDWLDGYLARKMRLSSAFGAFLDPVADKLMVAATLILLCSRPLEVAMFGDMPWLLTVPAIAIIGRESVSIMVMSLVDPLQLCIVHPLFLTLLPLLMSMITMSAVREWAASQSNKLLEAVAVNNLGKWKTATQMTALTILLATRDSRIGGPGILVPSGVVLLYISAGLSVWSLAVYMSKIWKVLMK